MLHPLRQLGHIAMVAGHQVGKPACGYAASSHKAAQFAAECRRHSAYLVRVLPADQLQGQRSAPPGYAPNEVHCVSVHSHAKGNVAMMRAIDYAKIPANATVR